MSSRSAMVPLLMLGLLAGCDRQVSSSEQAKATTAQATLATPAPGPTPAPAGPKEGEKVVVDAIGTLDRSHKGETAPAISFKDPAGAPTSIAAFRGKPVLLNLWATWCAPCVAEMPTLDALAKDMTVAAVSQDLGPAGAGKVKTFFAAKGFTRLQPYLDPDVGLSVGYNAELPTSILYDSTGHEVWRMTGGMDWTTPSARALLSEAK